LILSRIIPENGQSVKENKVKALTYT